MKSDINQLVKLPPPDNRLPPVLAPLPIRAKTGLERKSVGEVGSREVAVESTDGLFTFTVRVVA